MPERREISGSTETAYRAYEVDENDRIVTFTVINAHSDEGAIEQTQIIANGRSFELWDRGRMLIRLSPNKA